jgi:hypothetical protein
MFKQIAYGEIGSMGLNKIFTVDEDFYKILSKPPILCVHKESFEHSNAYIFGKLHDLKEYKFIGEHYNNAATTAMIDATNIDEKELSIINDLFRDISVPYDRPAVLKLQKHIPRLIFIGSTFGGDTGAAYFVHINSQTHKIDGLIIDAFCLFNNNFSPNKVKFTKVTLNKTDKKNYSGRLKV